MSEKNFASYGDMETLLTEIASKSGPYTEISYEDWLQLTPYQQEHGRWDVTGVPGADGTVSIDLMMKLWENPSPSSEFASQTIALSDGDYDYLMVMARYSIGDSKACPVVIGKSGYINFSDYSSSSSMVLSLFRSFGTNYSGTSVTFSDAKNNGAKNNNYLIPTVIYGIKLHHTIEIKAIAPTVSTLAKNSVFNPTGTDLESTNAEDAIKELESNFQDGVDAVYNAVVAKGSTPASHSLSDVVDGIASIETSPPTQTKNCTPSTSAQTITPDSGYLLSSVSVSAIQTQTKSCTPSTSAQTITPDSGKYLSKVSVSAISTQTKTVTSSRSAQNVTPDSGKYLTKVTVNKYPDASGNYTCGSNNGAASSNDMGATNNYRYVDATKVYNKGKSDGAATGTGGATEAWCFSNIGYGIQSLQGQGSQTHTVNGWAIITIYDPEGARNAPSWSSGVSVKTVYDVAYLRIYNAYKAGNWTVTLNPTGRDGMATVCTLY